MPVPAPPPPPPTHEVKAPEAARTAVLEAVEATKASLAAKDTQLTAIRTEFEKKKAEVGGGGRSGWLP
jgi:hypothetical protein